MREPVVKLGDLAEQIRGVTYKGDEALKVPAPGYLPVLRANNISDDGLLFDDLVYVPSSRVSDRQLIRRNDLVVATSSGSIDVVGKAAQAVADFEGSFGAFCKVIRFSERVHARYVAHYFKTREYRTRISALAAGANINNLRNEHLDKLIIPLPPLAEQRRIADILDRAEALRAKRREALGKVEELAGAVFRETIGDPVTNSKSWDIAELSEMCERLTVGVVVKPASYYVPSGVPALRSLNVKAGFIQLDDLVFFSEEDNRTKLAKSQLRTDDIVVIRSGRPGTAAIVPKNMDGVNAIDLIIVSLRTNRLLPSYLCALMNSPAGRRIVQSEERGQVQKHLNVGSLGRARIPVPPLSVQQAFADRLDAIHRLRDAQERSLAEMDALFASLQQRAFRGEL